LRIYEINTRVHCQSFDQITDDELNEISALGFDTIWLMGVWQASEGARKVSHIVSEDFHASPYAVPFYKFNRQLGGKRAFVELVKRAHRAGLLVIVDFVSNHMALDSPWIEENPEFFIRSDTRARKQATSEFFLHPSGEMIAFGRDPYFPPWHDTAQLDYTNAALRARMIDTLKEISRHADGVRCDMAMLVLRDYIRSQWYPLVTDSWFDERMAGEFWDEAIREVKASRPDFKFIAEAYWDKELYLMQLGFDLAYEKKLYDGLAHRNADLVLERLLRPAEILNRSLYFIENHDEPRAASVFGREANLAALALILSLPGSSLVHEGQMEGKRERLPVQRLKPLTNEPVDHTLQNSYRHILAATSDDLFKGGSFHPFDAGAHGVIAFARRAGPKTIAYLGQVAESSQPFNSLHLDISPLARLLGTSRHLILTNLMAHYSLIVEANDGRFRLWADHLGVGKEDSFCLIQAEAPK
jgi:glycosidase